MRRAVMMDFKMIFNRVPTVTAEAPGRVNLIGEHTDYNGGFVLPTAIRQRTRIELAPTAGDTVRVWSDAFGLTANIHEYVLGTETPGQGWLDYVQGITSILRTDGLVVRGFDARVASTVPLGSGLSSSASLTVALLRALREAFGFAVDDVRIARLGQRVENEFVGAQVGIMDPMAASLADEETALFLDARSLEFERVPLPRGADLVILHSGITHQHAAGDYNTRRQECEQAASLLGVPLLRDLSVADLPRMHALPEPLNRRARHVVTENDRVLAAVEAMKAGDLVQLGKLFFESHESMRDDYEVSIPEIDGIVELARADGAVFGARLTGGGFGGAVVMLARADAGPDVAQRIGRAYADRTGHRPRILAPAF